MGKKSLLLSTSQKKGHNENGEGKVEKSKATTNATKKVAKTASKKKTPTGAAAKKQVAPKKKTTSKGASMAKSSIKPKTKTTAAKKKPVSVKELLSKKFDLSVPEKQYTPPGDPGRETEISSPPFFVGTTPEETERIRQLLIKKFDTTFSKAVPKPAQEKLSGENSLSAVSTPGQDDNSIDEPVNSSFGLEGPAPVKKMDSMQKAGLIGILGLIVLLGLVMGASISNTAKFYLKPAKGELEIWKGRFSPMGKKIFVTLKATPLPAQPKEVYSRDEIFPFIFESYVNQADALLNASDMPDFELIRRTLNKALAFSVSPERNESIQRRLSKINLMALVYKADILADKNTTDDLSSARNALEKAMRLNLDEAEKGLVKQKLQWIYERQTQLEQMETESEEATSTGIGE